MTLTEQQKAAKRKRRIRWRQLHPEQWREEKRQYNRRRYARLRAAQGKTTKPHTPPAVGTINHLDPRALGKYGITQEDFDELFQKQAGRCAICTKQLKRPWTDGARNRAHVDHCHRTNIVRGILCGSCNAGIGMFHDDVWRLGRAIEYLRALKV